MRPQVSIWRSRKLPRAPCCTEMGSTASSPMEISLRQPWNPPRELEHPGWELLLSGQPEWTRRQRREKKNSFMKKYCTVFLISKNCYLRLLVDTWSKKSYGKPRQHIKKQTHHFASKGPFSQSYGLSSSHVQMWELDHKKGQEPKNWCFQTAGEDS